MRNNILILIVSIGFILFTDTLLFLLLKKYLYKKIRFLIYGLHSLLFLGGVLAYHFFIPTVKGPDFYYWIGLGIGIFFLFYIPKLIFIVLDLFSILLGLIHKKIRLAGQSIAAIIAVSCFILILYSITWGRYNYKTELVSICFPQLPPAFQNFRIVQLSDLHLGSSSTHYKGIPQLVEKVNALRPDVILFTGDMVNNFASEITPWIGILNKMNARYGKFAVTGNHDYGNYTHWESPADKARNYTDFLQHMKAAGFHLLNNAHYPLITGKDTIYIAGVENWGNPPFPRYGKLQKALEGVRDHFTVLMSHDPSHWRAQILDYNIPLTLSGHTHAMQLGIEIGNIKWSPSQYIYPEYDGLYEDNHRYLHVSRGQGYLGFPGRIGLRPAISVIILTNNCNER